MDWRVVVMGSTSDLSWHYFEWVDDVKGIPGTMSDIALREDIEADLGHRPACMLIHV
jgi:hypothetical protein